MKKLVFLLTVMFLAFSSTQCVKEYLNPDEISVSIKFQDSLFKSSEFLMVDGYTLDTIRYDRNLDTVISVSTQVWDSANHKYILRDRYDFKIIIAGAKFLFYFDDWREMEENGIYVRN